MIQNVAVTKHGAVGRKRATPQRVTCHAITELISPRAHEFVREALREVSWSALVIRRWLQHYVPGHWE
jgi:hypothetical protein